MSYLGRRLIFYVIAAWATITMNFFIPRLMPGNPVQLLTTRLQAIAHGGNGGTSPYYLYNSTSVQKAAIVGLEKIVA